MHADLRKIWIVASTEFSSMIRTKSFLIGIMLLPVITGASVLIQVFVAKRVDTRPRTIAVIDGTAALYPVPGDRGAGATTRRRSMPRARRSSRGSRFRRLIKKPGGEVDPAASPRAFGPDQAGRARRLRGDSARGDRGAELEGLRLRRQSSFTRTIPTTICCATGSRRRSMARSDRGGCARRASTSRSPTASTSPLSVDNLGLVDREASAAGGAPAIKAAQKVDMVRTMLVPAVLMFAMFFVIMTSAPQLLNSVLEEKMSKISEVLLGSITPFELMMGKLLGNVGIAMLLAALYVGGGYAVASYYGYADIVSPSLMMALGVFLVPGDHALRVALHGRRRGVQRAQGRPVADDAGHAPVDVPDVRLAGRAQEPVEPARRGAGALPAGQPVPDADANGPAARAPVLASRALDRALHPDVSLLRLGRRQDLPHRAAHARQGPELPRAGAVGRRQNDQPPSRRSRL